MEFTLAQLPRGIKGKRILVVDDCEDVREYLSSVLTRSGARVDTAKDGLDGWCKIDSAKYDLLILDIMLPGIDGWELFACIRNVNDNWRVPVIFISGLMQDKSWESVNSMPHDRVRVLSKTSPPSHLMRSIDELFALGA